MDTQRRISDPVTDTTYVGSASGVHPSASTLQRITDHLLASLGETVTWYYAQMPSYYLRVTSTDEQLRHVEMIHALRRGGEGRLTMLDDAESGKVLFFGRPKDHSLLDVVATLGDRPFHRVELHASKDDSLFLHAFVYAAGRAPSGYDMAAHQQHIMDRCCTGPDALPAAVVTRYLEVVDQQYLARSSTERVERHVRAWASLAAGADQVVRHDGAGEHAQVTRLLVATPAVGAAACLRHLARVLKRHHVHLERGYLDLLPNATDPNRQVVVSTVYICGPERSALPEATVASVVADLGGIRRLYSDEFVELYTEGLYSLDELEILRGAVGFSGQLLAPDHPFLDVWETGLDVLRTEQTICRDFCELLAARFRPGHIVAPDAWQTRVTALLERVRGCEPLVHAVMLEAMLSFITHILLTNAWRPHRLSLACFLDPRVLPAARFPEQPHGIAWIRGPSGRGCHVRFRPSARGGLRLLLPRTLGQHLVARDGLLKEVYDLAWAQQLKNKDIPEGGSKCIALIDRGADPDRLVQQVTDGLIDLILPPETQPDIIGPHGAPRERDLIFLGPDENMTPARINWVAERARQRHLPNHLTLMSSKPGSGINHKTYGVTSEGIYRWIHHSLVVLGIDGAWTLKITGGPDGDLGGNLIKILRREQGDRCRIVAIADGTGSATDPEGLDWLELLRLVDESKGIAQYRSSALRSSSGRVVPAVDKASEQARNDLHNTVSADLFVPCGGRPYTINNHNWQRFLGADGTPSARAMIEGANIFITSEARQNLEDAGLMVIKDSSANKGGVICSSYEVLAGLIMDEDEFLARKQRYVDETIAILHEKADVEARALFAAWTRRQRSARLSELSMQLSEEINRVSGLLEAVIAEHLDDADLAGAWRRHLEAHCPPVIVADFADRIVTHIPRPHRVAILAKRLASHMVYREGLTWCRTYLLEKRIWDVLATYLLAEERIGRVVQLVLGLDVPGRDEIARIISAGSQRELVRERLGQEF